MLTREEFDNLKYGDILVCEEHEYKVNHVVNDILFAIGYVNKSVNFSFWELNHENFSLKTETKVDLSILKEGM